MNQDEAERRDFNGEGQEPTNPIIRTDKGSWLTRAEYKDGQIDWYHNGVMVGSVVSDMLEDAFTMREAQ